MRGRVGTTSKVAAFVLQFVNFIVMMVCLFLFAFSLWMISSPSSLSTAIRNYGPPATTALLSPEILSVQLAVAICLVAIFIFFVANMGFYGSITRSQFLLFMYSTMVVLLLLLECALLFYFSSNLHEKGVQQQDGQWTHALRLAFQCCEFNITTVSLQSITRLPWSCCGTDGYPNNCTLSLLLLKDCNSSIKSWLHRYETAIYASLTALHLLLATCGVVRRSRVLVRAHR